MAAADTEKNLDEMTLEELERVVSKQRRQFVDFYDAGRSGAEAAIRAGFCVKTVDGKRIENRAAAAVTASRLLRDAKVAAYRRARARELYNNQNLSAEKLALMALDVYNQSMEGSPHLVYDYGAHEYVPDGTFNFNDRGAAKAIELLARLTGSFNDSLAVNGDMGVQIVNDIPKRTDPAE